MRALVTLFLVGLPAVSAAATCPNATDLLNIGPSAATGTTVGASDDYPQTCGLGAAGSSADAAYEFVAPVDGHYTFDTFGSGFDTALQAFADDCSTPIACADDSDGTLQSSLELDLMAGDRVVVAVGGYNGLSGPYVLNVAVGPFPLPEVCDLDDDIGSATGFDVLSIDTCGLGDDATPSCLSFASAADDALLSWTAPHSGTFTFSTAGSSFDTVMSLWNDDCTTEVDCNDDYGHRTSSITTNLAAGETVSIRVDAFSSAGCGLARVHVLEATCPDENMNVRCDQDDAWLTMGTPVVGVPVPLKVTNALPFSSVSFFVSLSAQTLTPVTCNPNSPDDCSYLINPRKVGTVVADANGRAQITTMVMPKMSGRTLYAQAQSTDGVEVRGTDLVYVFVP